MITKRQYETYLFIKDYIKSYVFSPSLTEVASGLGIKSKTTAQRNVEALVSAGLLKKRVAHRRNLELTAKTPASIYTKTTTEIRSIPLLGKIAAGQPVLATQIHEDINLDSLLQGHDLFMLQVIGESMIDAGINNQDFVICESCNTVKNGDIAVVLIDKEEVTLKRIHWLAGEQVMLSPENSAMKPRRYPLKRIEIQGVLKWQFRKY